MGFMEDMMAGRMGRELAERTKFPEGDELQKLRGEFKPIEGLKAGDKLRWKGSTFKNYKIPELGKVVEVFEVLDPPRVGGQFGSNHFLDRCDFSVLVQNSDNGEIYDSAFDSRRFERVEN